MENTLPWVEKYRPDDFDDIVLDKYNRTILTNMLNEKTFSNVIFYGPPGTGKTTTIINLLKKYQELKNQKGKDLIIHLNASDERGIEVVRNQIQGFVDSKNLFNTGHKFVILDEVDYMTKNAQQALRYLININKDRVSFCLICNYISKIDISLREEFINIRFNQLPKTEIITFLKKIVVAEKLNVSDDNLNKLQQYFSSDIRSMINYLQSNQIIGINNFNIINKEELNNIIRNKTTIKNFRNIVYEISVKYNISRNRLLYKLLQNLYYQTQKEDILKVMISCFHDNICIDLLINFIFYNI